MCFSRTCPGWKPEEDLVNGRTFGDHEIEWKVGHGVNGRVKSLRAGKNKSPEYRGAIGLLLSISI
jgi:hypothetical protein